MKEKIFFVYFDEYLTIINLNQIYNIYLLVDLE